VILAFWMSGIVLLAGILMFFLVRTFEKNRTTAVVVISNAKA